MNKRVFSWLGILLLACFSMSLRGDVSIGQLEVRQRWPWNGLVDITYSVESDEVTSTGQRVDVELSFSGYDGDRKKTMTLQTLTGDGVGAPVKAGGTYRTTWNAAKDYPNFNALDFRVKIKAKTVKEPEPVKVRYLVIDLSGGMEAEFFPHRYSETGPDLSNEACKTTELWLREIPAGTFMMGSPEDELGRKDSESLHQVTLTKSFFIGVFPVTMLQWKTITGYSSANSYNHAYAAGSMDRYEIRGKELGQGWPEKGHQVDPESYLGKLRAKTGLLIDLPTEAQWEYACRAGTTTALNSGENLSDTTSCPEMKRVGRFSGNTWDGKGMRIKVGLYEPNAWGLYDMHGNVWEWCLDHWDYYPENANLGKDPVTDPVGTPDGPYVCRGGSRNMPASECRSANRIRNNSSTQSEDLGLRIVVLPE